MQKERIRAHVHAGMVKWAGLGQQYALGETLASRQCPLKRCFSPNVKIYLQNVKSNPPSEKPGYGPAQGESKLVLKHFITIGFMDHLKFVQK